jgi:hypothetical protein
MYLSIMSLEVHEYSQVHKVVVCSLVVILIRHFSVRFCYCLEVIVRLIQPLVTLVVVFLVTFINLQYYSRRE